MSKVSTTDNLSAKTKEIIEVRLATLYQLRKTLVYKRPLAYQQLNLNSNSAHQYTHQYKSDVLKYWNTPDLSLLDNFDKKEISDITSYCKRNKHAVLCDFDPMVTIYDIKKACREGGVPLDYFKSYCQHYMLWHPWLPSIYTAMTKLFDPDYAVNLKKRMDAWVKIVD